MNRRRAGIRGLNPEIACELLTDRITEAFDRFGQEIPGFAFTPAMFADVIAELTRRNPYLMRLIFENPVVREAYERAIAERTATCEALDYPDHRDNVEKAK